MLIGVQGQQVAANLGAGGTVKGDLVVEGDFKVEGGGSFAFDEIIQGSMQVTGSNTFIDVLDTDSNLKVSIRGGDTVGAIGTYSNHPLSIRTNTTERIHITSAGLIGIGTSSPSTKLHVLETSSSSNGITVENSGGGDAYVNLKSDSKSYFLGVDGNATFNSDAFQIYDGTANVNRLLITSAGNIGIGTSSPSDKLHIADTGTDSDGRIRSSSQNVTSSIGSAEGDNRYFTAGAGLEIMTNTNHDIRFGTNVTSGNATPKMVLTTSGRLGIGTDSPAGSLSVAPDTDALTTLGRAKLYSSVSDYMYLSHFDHASGTAFAVKQAPNGSTDINSITSVGITISNQRKLTVVSSGNVGIGTSLPDELMHIKQTGNDITYVKVESTANHADAGSAIQLVSDDGISYFLNHSTSRTVSRYGTALGGYTEILGQDSANGLAIGTGTANTKIIFGVNNASKMILDDNSRISLSNNDSGSSNTVFGYNSGNSLISGSQQNAFYGEDSGLDTTTGGGNTALGWRALYENTTGNTNVAVGYYALKGENGNATGSNNVAVGGQALYALSTGSSNVALGYQSLYSMTGGAGNVALGHKAGYAVIGNHNVIIGSEANRDNNAQQVVVIGERAGLFNSGDNSVLIGHEAGRNSGTGTAQVYIGESAGHSATATGDIAIGQQAMYAGATGGGNYAIGRYAMMDANAGSSSLASTGNIALGQSALGGTWADATSSYNIAIGHYSMDSALNGASNNTAIGYNSLSAVTTGDNNVALGYNAGDAITTDQNVVAIGYSAYSSNDVSADAEGSSGHGSGNIAIGYQSMESFNHVDFLRNTAIGFQTMSAGTSDAAQDNVALGYRALQLVTTGDNNVVIGSRAGRSMTDNVNNTIIGNDAFKNADSGENNNVVIGHNAGDLINSSGCDNNVFIGVEAARTGTGSMSYNVAIGRDVFKNIGGNTHTGTIAIGGLALVNLSSGVGNTALGYQALMTEDTGGGNTAIGYQVMKDNDRDASDVGNTAVGYQAGTAFTSIQRCTVVGYQALSSAQSGVNNNTVIGWKAGLSITANDSTNNVIIGKEAGTGGAGQFQSNVVIGEGAMNSTGSQAQIGTVAIGRSALTRLTSGAYNTAIGYLASEYVTTGDGNTTLGYRALAGSAGTDDYNIAVGYQAMDASSGTGGGQNVFMGKNAGGGTWTTGACNYNIGIGSEAMAGALAVNSGAVGIGYKALTALTSGLQNTAVGFEAGRSLNTGGYNTFLGYEAGENVTDRLYNVAIGTQAMRSGGANSMIAIGYGALDATNSTGALGVIGIGHASLGGLTSGAGNVAVGYASGANLTTGHSNTFLGYDSGKSFDSGESNMTAIGRNAMGSANNDSSANCVAIGVNALEGGTGSVTNNIAIGKDAMSSTNVRNVDASIAIGLNAMDSTCGGGVVDCIAIGRDSMHHASNQLNGVTGSIGIGAYTLQDLTTGDNNVALGYQSGNSMTTANGATAVGAYSLDANTSGGEVVAIGYQALTAESFGGQVVAVGYQALKNQNKAGNSYNTAIGSQVGRNITNGEHNSLVGYRAGETLTTGDENILIGGSSDVSTADAQNQIVIGKGATGVGNNTAIIGNSSTTDVYMGDNGSTWSTTSDGRLKENVKDWNVGLDAINNLRIVSYNFKKDNPYKYDSDKKRQGIIAQEAQKVLPEMIKDDGEWLSANQEPMIWALVNAVQELSAEVNELKQQLKDKS